MKVAVPKETAADETRVALVPDSAKKLVDAGIDVVVESGAGFAASFTDAEYEEVGAEIAASPYEGADIVVKVQEPNEAEIGNLQSGTLLISFLKPLTSPELVRRLTEAGVTAFAMESIPRVTRAQSMDALSSQSNVAGYRAALIAAQELGKFFPLMMTAAGTVRPSKVLILGAGVAGLQAIATARRLGAEVSAFDVRSAVKEQIESLGAKFVELEGQADAEAEGGYARQLSEEEQRQQRDQLQEKIAAVDVVITTAQVPGKNAPILITEAGATAMKPGSVIVDLAAETGGNCELTKPGETAVVNGVKIVGSFNLPATMPTHASQLYSHNIVALLMNMVEEAALKLDFGDEITAGACITHQGKVVNEAVAATLGEPVGSTSG